MFGFIKKRSHEISLHRVRDRITVREGDETLTLCVDSDANSIISRLQKAQKVLSAIDGESTDEDRRQAARGLSESIFGTKQTDELFAFYNQDANCVVTICGMYFSDPKNGLGKKITRAQKKSK